MQSPNWLPHQPNIYVYEAGHLLAMPYLDPAAGGEGRIVNTGSLADCSGNYGISPDGRSLAVSCAQAHGGAHQVYVLPAGGTATPLQFTHGAQSFFHAWSPDSRTIAFTRGSASKADIFTVTAAAGGAAAIRIVSLSDGLIRTVTQLQGNRDSF
jgi:Tol biopolymer transport system component